MEEIRKKWYTDEMTQESQLSSGLDSSPPNLEIKTETIPGTQENFNDKKFQEWRALNDKLRGDLSIEERVELEKEQVLWLIRNTNIPKENKTA